MRKTARIVERFAEENKAVIVVGGIEGRAKEGMEGVGVEGLGIGYTSGVATITKLLEEKPVHVARVSERGSSSVDPLSHVRVKTYTPL